MTAVNQNLRILSPDELISCSFLFSSVFLHFFLWCWVWNPGPCAHWASALPMRCTPSPSQVFLKLLCAWDVNHLSLFLIRMLNQSEKGRRTWLTWLSTVQLAYALPVGPECQVHLGAFCILWCLLFSIVAHPFVTVSSLGFSCVALSDFAVP